MTTLIRHATSVTYKVESIFEADTKKLSSKGTRANLPRYHPFCPAIAGPLCRRPTSPRLGNGGRIRLGLLGQWTFRPAAPEGFSTQFPRPALTLTRLSVPVPHVYSSPSSLLKSCPHYATRVQECQAKWVSVKFLRRVVDLAWERGHPPPRRGEALPRPSSAGDARVPMTAWERERSRPHAAKMAALHSAQENNGHPSKISAPERARSLPAFAEPGGAP